jgi:hypothetical protein
MRRELNGLPFFASTFHHYDFSFLNKRREKKSQCERDDKLMGRVCNGNANALAPQPHAASAVATAKHVIAV